MDNEKMMDEIKDLKMQALRNAKPLFDEQISKCTKALVVDLDEDNFGIIVYATSGAKELFGYNNLDGKRLRDLIPERFRDRHDDHIRRFRSEPEKRLMGSLQMSLIGLRMNNNEFVIEIELNPVEIIGRKLVIAILLEIKK